MKMTLEAMLMIIIGVGFFTAISVSKWDRASADCKMWGVGCNIPATMLTMVRTADSVLVEVSTTHDLSIDPDKWNLPAVVTAAVRSATSRFTVDSIMNYHDDFTTQIIRDAQMLAGNTNIRITVNAVSWDRL